MNLVVGATGSLGGEICALLTDKGKPIKALVRSTSDQAKVEALKRLGATLVYGDLKHPDTLDDACQGVRTIISTASITRSRQPDDTIAGVDQAGQISLIDAARAAKVAHFIYVSYSGNLAINCPLTTAKRRVEQVLQRSELVYTILRPSYFMEAWLSPGLGFDYLKAKVRLYGSGQNEISWISRGDVAWLAVEALDNPAARNAIIELGGPEALSPLAAVRIFEAVSGRSFEVEYVTEAALQAQKTAATDPLAQSIATFRLNYAQGDPIDMQATRQAFPGQLLSVRDYAQRVLGSS